MGDESAQPDPFVGDWDWDPSEDPEWDDPSIPRVRVDPLEIPELASAIVRGASLSYAFIPDLRALVDTIQAHPNAQLAKASEPDANGFIHTDDASPETPSGLTLRGCVVDACEFSDLDIGVTLSINARFAAVARFDRARFAADAWFDRARFDADAWFDEARFAAVAWFGGARFAAVAGFGDASVAGDARFENARVARVARVGSAGRAAV
ncbi:MAG: pentapeptide repeat-containing protein, partial [Planctomycetota bacterium]